MAAGVILGLGLVAYNTVTNLWLSDSGYVARNVVVGAGLVALARASGLGWQPLGLAPDALGAGWRWGRGAVLAVAVAVAIVGALAGSVEVIGRLLADRRADLPTAQLAWQALVRIPVGTALFEEVAFRGVLLAVLLRAASVPVAVAVASMAFGLWHIAPTIETLHLNDVGATWGPVTGVVVLTTVVGAAFCWLRLASGSLVAPVLAHWAVNALFLLTAALFHRTGA